MGWQSVASTGSIDKWPLDYVWSGVSKLAAAISGDKKLNGIQGSATALSEKTSRVGATPDPTFVRRVRDCGGTFQFFRFRLPPDSSGPLPSARRVRPASTL